LAVTPLAEDEIQSSKRGKEAKKSLSNFLYIPPPSAAHKWQKFIYSLAGWLHGWIS
jgi:hypothetical protein